MRRIFWSISSRQVLVISTVIFLLCIEHQLERRVRIQQAVSQRHVPKILLQDAPDSVVNVEQVQGLAVMFRFLPAGRIETVELDVSRLEASPLLRVVILQDDGTLLRMSVLLEGLKVVRSQDGVINLHRVGSPPEHQMIAEGQVF